MKLENISIPTGVMQQGMNLRDFFEEALRCSVPGLPYVNENEQITGRISLRDVYKKIVIPESLLPYIDMLGDNTDNLDVPELDVIKKMALPIEDFVLDDIPSVSSRSSIVKALTLMEVHNSSYIFLIDEGVYKGVVTRMVVARRMLRCIKDQE